MKRVPPCNEEGPARQEPKPGTGISLGGWLILVGIGMIANPVLRIFFALRNFSEFPNDNWDLKNTLWFYVSHSIDAMLVAYGMVVAVAFFRRKRYLPLLFQAYLATAIIGAVAGQTLNCLLLELDYDLIGLGRQVLISLIWMSYFERSRRVEATFVS